MSAVRIHRTRWLALVAALVAAVIALGFTLAQASSADAAKPAVTGNPNASCPEGTVVIAKYEWTGGGYAAEFGGDIVSVSGDASSASFTSTEPISAVVVKGGTDTKTVTFDGALSGSVTNSGLVNNGGQTPDISNLQFCGGVPYVDGDNLS